MQYEDVKVGRAYLLINDSKHKLVLRVIKKEKKRSRIECYVMKSVEESVHRKGDVGYILVSKLYQLSPLTDREAVLELL